MGLIYQVVLGVTVANISRLRQSANNLCPTKGGRHAEGAAVPIWGLVPQREFTAMLLRNWIYHLADASQPELPC